MLKKCSFFAVAVSLWFFAGGCGPDLKQFEPLKEPRIVKMPDQKMLSVELKGAPEQTTGKAFKSIFKIYFGLPDAPKNMAAPRARWPQTPDVPKDEWIGIFGVPVAGSVEKIPDQKEGEVKVELKTWKYGEVAEMLHIGGYDQEAPTIEKLYSYIKEKGYKIAGPHEEEYLKGPGMFLKGNPKNYYTIIRYQIEKIKQEKAKPKAKEGKGKKTKKK